MSDKTELRRLAAIMFTDMVGFSALAQRDEKLSLLLLAEQQRLLRKQFLKSGGREVKVTGDGFLVEFPSALAATECAVAIQRAIASRNSTEPSDRQFQVRIGIHVGDVVYRDADMFGDGVNIAARIEPLAKGGGICISETVYDQVRNKVDVGLTKLVAPELKSIAEPVDVYRVVLPWEGDASESSRIGPKGSELTARRNKLLALASVGVGVLAVVGIGFYLNSGGTDGRSPPKSPTQSAKAPADQKSVAVLPFVNMSADKNDEYLSDGMTEEVLNRLAQVPGLRVPGRTSCFAFKGRTEDDIFRKVGEQLQVATVLEGSVRKAGSKLRITAQLINVADGFHLWSQTYDRDMKDILAVQSSVAKQVVQALQMKLGIEETRDLAKSPTVNPEAHRLYLLGRYHFFKMAQASLTTAMQCFNQALKEDPTYALAYCGLADCYGWMGMGAMSGKEAWSKEKELAQKALALDPNLADAHLSLGIALASAFDWTGGEREMRLAIQLNPRLALAYDQLAWMQSLHGRFDEAISNEQKAVDLDPLSLMFNANLCEKFTLAHRYDEAKAQLRKTMELDPNYAAAHYEAGINSESQGDIPGAIAAYQKAVSLDPDPFNEGILAYAQARAGNREKAEQMLRKLGGLAKQTYVSPGLRAILYVGLGEKDKALDWLERGYADQDFNCWNLKVLPIFDPLRNEPRFLALLNKLGFDQ